MIGDIGIKVSGLGVIVYKNGVQAYEKFCGSRKLGEKNLPVTRDTKFRVASLSKQFTIFTIMQLVEQGKINLDEDVSKYLDFNLRNPRYPDVPITVRMLASHISSIRDGKIYSTPPNFGLAEFFMPNGKFYEGGTHFGVEPPEKFFTYCNLNYGILGTIIEVVTGKRFDIYQRENILSQLDTRADYVVGNLPPKDFKLLGTLYAKENFKAHYDDYTEQPARDTISLQNPYAEDFCGVYNLRDYKVGTNATIFSPQGGLRISFEELTHAMEMILNGGNYRGRKILSEKSLAEMFKPQWVFDAKKINGDTCGGVMLSYGLGEYQIDGKSTARLCKNHEINFVGHTGIAFGLLAGMFFRADSKDALLYIINGHCIDEDKDPRAKGNFSGNYIWEEIISDAVINFLQ
ncbi:MAG: beta-lactamase family protein [Selenomonadaceae bacterium]|nr:beta-lactamase family protein [Selenomonadaceae bacterium]